MNLLDFLGLRKNKTRTVEQNTQLPKTPIPASNQTVKSIVNQEPVGLRVVQENKSISKNIGGWKYRVLPLNAINLAIIKYHIQPQQRMDICIVEIKAQVHKIFDQYNINRKVTRYLAFPNTVFLIILYTGQLAELFHYFSSYSINGLDSRLYFPPLTNTDSSGRVCYGDDREWYEINSRLKRIPSLRGKVVEVIDEYWRTAFTNHLAETHQIPWGRIDPRISSFESWERSTQTNPDFILNVPWHRRSARTVEYLLNNVWR